MGGFWEVQIGLEPEFVSPAAIWRSGLPLDRKLHRRIKGESLCHVEIEGPIRVHVVVKEQADPQRPPATWIPAAMPSIRGSQAVQKCS